MKYKTFLVCEFTAVVELKIQHYPAFVEKIYTKPVRFSAVEMSKLPQEYYTLFERSRNAMKIPLLLKTLHTVVSALPVRI